MSVCIFRGSFRSARCGFSGFHRHIVLRCGCFLTGCGFPSVVSVRQVLAGFVFHAVLHVLFQLITKFNGAVFILVIGQRVGAKSGHVAVQQFIAVLLGHIIQAGVGIAVHIVHGINMGRNVLQVAVHFPLIQPYTPHFTSPSVRLLWSTSKR